MIGRNAANVPDADIWPVSLKIRLGRHIRGLRQRRGWTQTYLAVHTRLSRAFTSDLENGKKGALLPLPGNLSCRIRSVALTAF